MNYLVSRERQGSGRFFWLWFFALPKGSVTESTDLGKTFQMNFRTKWHRVGSLQVGNSK